MNDHKPNRHINAKSPEQAREYAAEWEIEIYRIEICISGKCYRFYFCSEDYGKMVKWYNKTCTERYTTLGATTSTCYNK